MNKNRFIKELRDYFSIFASFLIVFVLFSTNMSFAAANCADIKDFTKREHCRDYGESAFTVGNVDMDGNKPITCKGISLDYNPYTSDDYYYESGNGWCLGWALDISIAYSALSVAAGFACTVAGAPPSIGPMTQKAAKLEKLREVFDIIKEVGQGTIQVAQATALSALTNPVIALQADFAIDAVTIGVILGINIATCTESLGVAANACTAAVICGGMLAELAAASQTLIFATTGSLYGAAKDQIDDVKVCGYDWNTYAYTEYDMQQPEREWYPQYGSFSNSYSYTVSKIIKGEYSCIGYLKDDNAGKDNVEFNTDTSKCVSSTANCGNAVNECIERQKINNYYNYGMPNNNYGTIKIEECLKECNFSSSSCGSEVNACIERQKKNNYGTVNIDECLTDSVSCSAYCKGFFAKCVPIIPALDGDGVCKDNNGSVYKKDNKKDEFKCKGVKSNYKNARNKFYRESIYKGKEFKISTKYTDSSDCIDPRLDDQKGYTGLEQRYYFRGKESAQYACNRFKYRNNGCRLSDGTVITQEDAAADPTKDLKCRQAFQDANSCCQNRRTLGICIYNNNGWKSDRNNNTLCMRSLDGKADNCGLNTGYINNPKFVAYSGEADSTQICVKNVNYCPYTYNVSGGTELQELYCGGDNNCTNCVQETGDKNDEWDGAKYRDSKGKIKEEYRYTIPLCSDKDTIWKKDKYKYPTMAYGNIKNFCRYRAHCTEIGESDYEFVDVTGNKFLPKVCSDFVGDSQNLPYPVKVADISMAGSVRSIFKAAGANIGDGTLNSLYAAIDKMDSKQLAEVYSKIMAERAIISLAVGMVGGSFAGPLAGILTGASAGVLYTIQDVKNAVESDGNSKNTLKAIVRDIVSKPLISGVDFSLGEYRGFTAPIAQCIKETLNNMFLNKAGQSICSKEGEKVNSEGLCGNDTFGPPKNIRKDAYIQMIGEQLPEDSNIFYKIQTRLQTIIKIVAALAIFIIGLKFLMKGDIDIFDIKKPKAVIVGMLKFAIVFYFAVGNAWQSQFYDWIDKATQYMYYKSFDLSLVGYQDYKNQSDKTICNVVTKTKFCKDYTYQEPVEVVKEVEKEGDVCKTFEYTGSVQTFTVPVGVSKLSLKVWGAGTSNGRGGYSYGDINTSSGKIFYIYVGGKDRYNGGQTGGAGATDIRISDAALTCNTADPRIIVAGGAGGGAGGAAGGGANDNGTNGTKTCSGCKGEIGTGGTSTAGGSVSGSFEYNGATYCADHTGGSCGIGGYGAYGNAGGGGGWFGGGAGCELSGGGGGSGHLSSSIINGGGTSDSNSDNGKAEVCYKEKYTESETVTEYEYRVGNFCDYDITSTENNKVIEDLSNIPSPTPTTSEEVCRTYLPDSVEEYKKCYSHCKTGPDYDENGNQVFEYSDTYDGCYFGDNVYPEGKSYLAIFDSLDCKLMNYFAYGPDVDLPGILHMLLISLIFSPLALVTVILGTLLFVILLVIVLKVLYLFLMTMIAINIMIFVSPVIFPTLLFEKYKGVFTKWLDNLMSFCLQFVFVVIFVGFLIGNLDKFAIGSARWVGHDRTTGRLPTLVCGDASDSIVCIFKVNTNKGTKPMLGEKIGKFLGIGPVVSLVQSISRDFAGTVMTLLKFCLIIYVLLEFLKKIPGVAAELTNGTALDGGQLDVKEIMGKIKDTTETVTRGATGALKKGAKSLGDLKKNVGDTKNKIKEARAAGDAINDKKFGDDGKDDKKEGGLEGLSVKKQDSESKPSEPSAPPPSE